MAKEAPEMIGPTTRPDSAPIHANAIRAFREELRLGRREFAGLIEANPDTVRGWEIGASVPRGEAAMKIVELAQRNRYPLSLESIFKSQTPERRKKRRRRSDK